MTSMRCTILKTVMILIFAQSIAFAATVDLPETGQTTCYDYYDSGSHVGAPISCTDTGQDGDLQAGTSWPNPRFDVTYCNAAGPCPSQASDCDANAYTDVVTDNLTGLMWPRHGDLTSEVTWQGGLDHANGLDLCGFTDWHLPNFNEMQSLLNAGFADSHAWLNSQVFIGVEYSYWTSTTQMWDTDQDYAWWVELDDGTTYTTRKNRSDHPSWPVRQASSNAPSPVWQTGQDTCYDEDGVLIDCTGTGQDGDLQEGAGWPSPRFTDNGNGTIADNLTGLIWLKDTNCLGVNYPAQVPQGRGNWQTVLAAVTGINDGTYGDCSAGRTDWRLPNRKEIQSLLDYSNTSPSIPSGHPFSNVLSVTPLHFWTSTSSGYTVDDPNFRYAWYVSLYDGMIDNSPKDYTSPRIWLVRGPVVAGRMNPGIRMLLLDSP